MNNTESIHPCYMFEIINYNVVHSFKKNNQVMQNLIDNWVPNKTYKIFEVPIENCQK